uniref:GRAM domain containing 2A n=1 Tax=Ficedula albicollis TaxID=59894 RepID=A0A803V0A1_FICAL
MHEKAAPLKSPEPRHGREKLEVFQKQKSLDSLDGSLRLNETLKDEEIKKCHREVAASKYNSQYHKLFKDIPTEESVLKGEWQGEGWAQRGQGPAQGLPRLSLCLAVCSCALQRDILIQGRLYISPNWLCFYANLFGKDIKVVIPVVSVQLIKKHKTARLLPNGLAITTTASRKYIFVSLISRDSVYDVLRRVCTHLQVPPLCVPLCVHGPEALHLPFGLSTALHHCLQGSGLLPKPSPIPSILTAARDGKRGRSHALGTSCPRGLFWVMDEAEL